MRKGDFLLMLIQFKAIIHCLLTYVSRVLVLQSIHDILMLSHRLSSPWICHQGLKANCFLKKLLDWLKWLDG